MIRYFLATKTWRKKTWIFPGFFIAKYGYRLPKLRDMLACAMH